MKGVSNLGPQRDGLTCHLCMYVQEENKKLGEKCTNRCKNQNSTTKQLSS